jgi:hypothetical protein
MFGKITYYDLRNCDGVKFYPSTGYCIKPYIQIGFFNDDGHAVRPFIECDQDIFEICD